MSFDNLGLSEETLRAVRESGYTQPTPIQEKAIPSVLMMRDVIGLAQTGTGKTASFTLPMIDILSGGRARMRMPRSLVLEPTRELAAQVAENFDKYGEHHKLSKVLLVGGESMGEQMKLLEKGVDVLIATPGRLLDLFERGAILLSDIKILVIDEADRMLDMGFIPDIDRICSLLPPTRQTLLFSATMPPEIKRLTEKYLSNPKEISVAPPASTAENVKQSVMRLPYKKKEQALVSLIERENVKNAFIFLNRKKDIGGLAQALSRRGLKASPMHGDMPQAKRNEVLQAFKNDEVTLLICSDVAARGLDIKGVSHVFNFDIPMHPDDYVHRIGRTGRAGMSGRAFTFVSGEDDEKRLANIERLIKKSIDVENLDVADDKQDRPAPKREKQPRSSEASEKKVGGERRARASARDDETGGRFGVDDDIPDFLRR
jgi:superfamily II DNA/RNA helicase